MEDSVSITQTSGLCVHEHQCTYAPSHICGHIHANMHTHRHTYYTCTLLLKEAKENINSPDICKYFKSRY